MTSDERLQAERACERVIKRFGILADAGRFDELSMLFTRDARFNRPSETDRVLEGREAILRDFAGRPKPVSAHLTLNTLVDVASTVRASAVSYIVAISGPPGAATPEGFPLVPPRTRIGVFEDELRVEDGEWRIALRAGRMILITDK